jgi:exosome complex exonuclease DIS3/RRP44
MLKSKAYIRRTRKGNVVKVIREHCKSSERSDFWVDLRDDIGCGLLSCQQCVQLSSIRLDPSLCEDKSTVCPVAHYIVADTNVLFHQVGHERRLTHL